MESRVPSMINTWKILDQYSYSIFGSDSWHLFNGIVMAHVKMKAFVTHDGFGSVTEIIKPPGLTRDI